MSFNSIQSDAASHREVENVIEPTGLQRIERLEQLLEEREGVYACGGYIPKTEMNAQDLVIYYTHVGGEVDDEGILHVPKPKDA